MTNDLALSIYERQEQILRFLAEQRRLTVAQICERFGVSLATARRDLETLAEQGKLQRIHGGAVEISPPEQPILQRSLDQAAEKASIGRRAAALVHDGETVFLGSGTTVLEVARNLKSRRNLTVITNSLPVLNALSDAPEIALIDPGGMFRRSELSLIGHITEQSLAQVRADKVILGIRAIDPEQGLTNHYLPETMTDRAILSVGRQVILVADHTKCGRVSTAFVAPISAVHTLVTDAATPAEFIAAVEVQGVKVILAPVAPSA